jgi:hypothetical protein
MAFSAVAFIAPNYRDFKNYWLKAYNPGTTTPKVMALDGSGTVQVAKLQLNANGFIVSAGQALVVPYIDGPYDLWLFPTSTEADANDTSSAKRVADNIEAIGSSIINDLSQAYIFDTVGGALGYEQSPIVFPVGKTIHLNDRGADFTIISGTGTANGIDIIASTPVNQSANQITNLDINLNTMGLQTATDIKPLLDRAILRLPLGGKITIKKALVTSSDTIDINTPFINLCFVSTTLNPIAAFPSTNMFNVTAANVRIKNINSDIGSQLVTLLNASALATNLKVFNTVTTNAGGQVIVSAAANTMVSGVDATNCGIDTFTAANGVVSLNGNKSKAFDINISDCFGKAIAFRGNDSRLKGFDISRILNQGSAGGIGVYVGFETENNVITKGNVRDTKTHCIKLSGGSARLKVSKINLFNNGDTVVAGTNAMLEVSGVSNSSFSDLYIDWVNGAESLDAGIRFVFHSGPDYPSIDNQLSHCIFNSNDPTNVPRALSIVGGVGLNSSRNTIDHFDMKGTVTIGATAGDTGNTLQDSTITCESFTALTTTNSTDTKILTNTIINTRERAGNSDYLIRSDSSSGLTVKGNTLKGASIGIRSTDPDLNITGNDFRMVKNADSLAVVRNIQMSGAAAGIYANNNLREATADIGTGLLTTANNNVTSAL